MALYSLPHAELFRDSFKTLYACTPSGVEDLRIIDITSIQAVVAMIPMPHVDGDPPGLWTPVEKSGMDDMDGLEDADDDGEDDAPDDL